MTEEGNRNLTESEKAQIAESLEKARLFKEQDKLVSLISDMISCSNCGTQIAKVIEIEGEDLIQVGALVVTDIHGNCAKCGEEFHYSLNHRRLERIVRSRIERLRF